MPWYDVEIENSSGRCINVAGDHLDAARAVENERNSPIYCRLHDELPAKGRIDGKIGEMGYFTPRPVRATAVRPMCQPTGALLVYPAGDWIAL